MISVVNLSLNGSLACLVSVHEAIHALICLLLMHLFSGVSIYLNIFATYNTFSILGFFVNREISAPPCC